MEVIIVLMVVILLIMIPVIIVTAETIAARVLTTIPTVVVAITHKHSPVAQPPYPRWPYPTWHPQTVSHAALSLPHWIAATSTKAK